MIRQILYRPRTQPTAGALRCPAAPCTSSGAGKPGPPGANLATHQQAVEPRRRIAASLRAASAAWASFRPAVKAVDRGAADLGAWVGPADLRHWAYGASIGRLRQIHVKPLCGALGATMRHRAIDRQLGWKAERGRRRYVHSVRDITTPYPPAAHASCSTAITH